MNWNRNWNWTVLRTPLALLFASGAITGAAVAANDENTTEFSESEVGAWLASDGIGSVSHVGPGGVDALVELTDPQGRIEVVTVGDDVFLVDESGRMSRLDPATLKIATEQQGDVGARLVGAGDRLYSINMSSGTIQEIETTTLKPVGSVLEFDGPIGDGVVDDEGVLWLVHEFTGEVLAIDGTTIRETHPIATPGVEVDLAITDAGPVAIDSMTASITVIGRDGTDHLHDLPFADGLVLQAPDRTNGATVLAVLGGETIALFDPISGEVQTMNLDTGGHRLGSPRTTAGHVFIPDFTDGQVHVIDLDDVTDVRALDLPGAPGQFEVIVDDQVAYVNDQDSERVWLVDPAGTVNQTAKYDPTGLEISLPTRSADRSPDPTPDEPPPGPETSQPRPEPQTTETESANSEQEASAPAPGGEDAPEQDGDDQPTPTSTPPDVTRPNPATSTDQPASQSEQTTTATTSPQSTPTSPGQTPSPTDTVAPDPNPILGAPRNVVVQPGDGQVTVRWDLPSSGAFTGFSVSVTSSSGSTVSQSVSGPRTSVNIRSLQNGVAHIVTIVAVHAGNATGNPVTIQGIVPVGRPTPPRQVTGSSTSTGDGIALAWAAPADAGGGAVQRYEVTGRAADGSVAVNAMPVSQRSVLIPNLTRDETYTFEVVAIASGGRSDPASSPAITTTAQTTPTATTAPPTTAPPTTASPTTAPPTTAPPTTQPPTTAPPTTAPPTTAPPTTAPPTTQPPTTLPPPPGAVQNLRVHPLANELSFEWDPVAGASYYEYRVDVGPWLSTTNTNANPLVGITVRRTGIVTVRAVNAGGTGPLATVNYSIITCGSVLC